MTAKSSPPLTTSISLACEWDVRNEKDVRSENEQLQVVWEYLTDPTMGSNWG